MGTLFIPSNYFQGNQVWVLKRMALAIALSAGVAHAQTFTQTQAFSGSTSYEQFGYSVAMSGATMVVGETGGFGQSLVKIYRNASGSWLLYDTITPPASASADGGGFGYSVSISDDTMIVGAPLASAPDPQTYQQDVDAGLAYVYHINENCSVDVCVPQYTLAATLMASTVQKGAQFGSSVAVGGDVVVVGSPDAIGGEGAAFVYNRNANAKPDLWGLTTTLTPYVAQSAFGATVATDGVHVLVGAPGTGSGGFAVLYTVDSLGNAVFSNQLTSNTPSVALRFGASVAITPANLAVGAPGGGATSLPSVDLYGNDSGDNYTFIRQLKPVAAVAGSNDYFGSAVAFDGTSLAVGADEEAYANVLGVGAIYVYKRGNSGAHAWCLNQELELGVATVNTYDPSEGGIDLGYSIAFDGAKLAGGAPRANLVGAPIWEGTVFTFSADEIFSDGFESPGGAVQCF